MTEATEKRDFFISFTKADLAYAKALDATLRAAGFTTFFYPNDLGAGGNIPMWMDDALMNSAQTWRSIHRPTSPKRPSTPKPSSTRPGGGTQPATSAS